VGIAVGVGLSYQKAQRKANEREKKAQRGRQENWIMWLSGGV